MRRRDFALAPLAILPAAVATAASTPALPVPIRRVVVVDLGHGAKSTIDLSGGGPGDELFQPALLKMSVTVDLGPDDEKQTVQLVFAGGGHPADRRPEWLRSPEAREAGYREIAGGGYIYSAVRPIV